MRRQRHAFVFPGTHRVGFALAVTEDDRLSRIAVGSVPASLAAHTLREFGADAIYFAHEDDGAYERVPVDVGLPDTGRILFARDNWRQVTGNLPRPFQRKVGWLAQNAYRMAFSELLRQRGFKLSRTTELVRLSSDWVTENGT